MMLEKFKIGDTLAASKINVLVYYKDKEIYILQRYKTVDGKVYSNWLDDKGNLLEEDPDVTGFESFVAI